ncbi:MAG TPA: hypothetical protein DCQ68_19180 [Chryseobacterium indologenes]|nr:hypothetical protein [Chryseobacterium indologenes]
MIIPKPGLACVQALSTPKSSSFVAEPARLVLFWDENPRVRFRLPFFAILIPVLKSAPILKPSPFEVIPEKTLTVLFPTLF